MHADVFSSSFSRRSMLRIGAGVAAAAAGGSLLLGCSDGGSGGEPVPVSDRVPLPTHVPFEGAKPDLLGRHGSADGFLHYPTEPPVTVAVKSGDGKPISAMLSIYYPAWPSPPENAAWANLNDQLGSELQFQQVPGTEYGARFATRVAGNDLPTMMEIGKVARTPDLLEAKFIDLTEHLSGDAVTKYPNLANIPSETWRAAVFNNAIYGIPTCRGMWQASVIFHRTDLIEAKGLSGNDIRDFDDLLALCLELTDDSTSALASQPVRYLQQMAGVPNEWSLDGDTLTHAYEAPEQEQVLEACLRLAAEGVVRPDWHTLNSGQIRQHFLAGKVMMCNGSYQGWSRQHRQHQGGGEFDFDALPLPGFAGGKGMFHLPEPAWSIGAISKGNEDRLETLLQVWNYLVAPFGSAEHLDVVYGKEWADYALTGSDPVQTERGKREAMLLTTIVCAPQVAYYPNDNSVTKKIHAHMAAMAGTNATQNAALYRYSETESQKSAALQRKIDDVFTDIILGRKKISDWAAAVSRWRSNGGDKIRAELEEALAAE